MKTIFLSMLIIGFMLMSCKKESQTREANSDSITIPDTVNKIPVSAPVDTLIAASKTRYCIF